MMGADQFLLTWNNHKANFASVFSELRLQGQLVDVTLLCDGGSFPAHRLVLAACSPYFASLFSTLDNAHPLIFLRDVRQAELEALLEFIYRGQVSVANSELGGLIKIAESLRIKGLGDVSQRDPSSPPPSHGSHSFMRPTQQQPITSSPIFPKQNHCSKRPPSPIPLGDGLCSNSNPTRPKKIQRRGDNVNVTTTNTSLPDTNVSMDDSGINASNGTPQSSQIGVPAGGIPQGMYLPDLTALFTAANSYTHGLAASFPAFAAVSAAAAELSRQNTSTQKDLSVKIPAEESVKLRTCLQRGKEPCKNLKSEKSELAVETDEEPSVPSVDLTGDDVDSSQVKSEEDCQKLMQQIYGTNSSVPDVNSLLSTYQQLLCSVKEGQNHSLNSSEEGVIEYAGSAPHVGAPSTVQDSVITLPSKDAKCLTCKICGATIKHTANFRRHMKQHLNPRRYPCPWCSAAFGRKDNLKTHTRKHHPNEVEAQEIASSTAGTMSLSMGSSVSSSGLSVSSSMAETSTGGMDSSSKKVNGDLSGEEGEEESGREGNKGEENSLVIDEEEDLEEEEEE